MLVLSVYRSVFRRWHNISTMYRLAPAPLKHVIHFDFMPPILRLAGKNIANPKGSLFFTRSSA